MYLSSLPTHKSLLIKASCPIWTQITFHYFLKIKISKEIKSIPIIPLPSLIVAPLTQGKLKKKILLQPFQVTIGFPIVMLSSWSLQGEMETPPPSFPNELLDPQRARSSGSHLQTTKSIWIQDTTPGTRTHSHSPAGLVWFQKRHRHWLLSSHGPLAPGAQLKPAHFLLGQVQIPELNADLPKQDVLPEAFLAEDAQA